MRACHRLLGQCRKWGSRSMTMVGTSAWPTLLRTYARNCPDNEHFSYDNNFPSHRASKPAWAPVTNPTQSLGTLSWVRSPCPSCTMAGLQVWGVQCESAESDAQ
eukprot:6060758-Amphidinium_carterae.1